MEQNRFEDIDFILSQWNVTVQLSHAESFQSTMNKEEPGGAVSSFCLKEILSQSPEGNISFKFTVWFLQVRVEAEGRQVGREFLVLILGCE